MDYSRSDRKDKPRISTMGKFMANCVNRECGVKKVLLLDPHSEYIKEYFDPTADEISAKYLWIDYLEKEIFPSTPREKCAIVFSDVGSAKRYREVPNLLQLPYAYLDKAGRDKQGTPEIKGVVGDVSQKACMLIDDEALGGGTLTAAVNAIIQAGADSVYAFIVHGILSKKGMSACEVVKKLEDSPVKKIIVTNSVPLGGKLAGTSKFHMIRIEGLLAEAIRRTVLNEPLTELYLLDKVPLYRIDP